MVEEESERIYLLNLHHSCILSIHPIRGGGMSKCFDGNIGGRDKLSTSDVIVHGMIKWVTQFCNFHQKKIPSGEEKPQEKCQKKMLE